MVDKKLNEKIKRMGYSPFVVKKEEPNFYKIIDGTILKIHPILNAITMDKGKSPEGAFVGVNNVVHAFLPRKFVGKPDQKRYTIDQINKNVDIEDIEFDVVAEHFNEYVVDGEWLLKLKTTLSQVNRSKLRNNKGEIIYSVNTNIIPKFKKKSR